MDDCGGTGMASPLLGIAGVNSLLFAAYAASKRVISPFPDLNIQEIALAGGMAGAINAILASPGRSSSHTNVLCTVPSRPNQQLKCSKLGCKVSMVPQAINGSESSQEKCGKSGVLREGS